MKSRRTLRLALAGLLAFLFVAAALPASAHPVESSANFRIGNLCVIGSSQLRYYHEAEVDHAAKTSSAFAKTTVRLSGRYACDTIDMFPPGQLLARVDLQRWDWDQYNQTWRWFPCRTTGWVSNTTWTDHVEAPATYGATYPACDPKYPHTGPGYFRAHGMHFVKVGNDWQGGEKSTTYHYMPQ